MGLYAAPLLAAWLWLGYARTHSGAGVSVNGELITPAVPVSGFMLEDEQGATADETLFRKKWSLVYFAGIQCGEVCEKNLYHMRQVRLSTGRRMDRVQRVLVTPQPAEVATRFEKAKEGLRIIGGADTARAVLSDQFNAAQQNMEKCVDCIYLVDPLGNIMMRFAPDLDPGKIYKDLKHLLKVSRIG